MRILRVKLLPLVALVVALAVAYVPWMHVLSTQITTLAHAGFWYHFNPFLDFPLVLSMSYVGEDASINAYGHFLPIILLGALVAIVTYCRGWFLELKQGKRTVPLLTMLTLLPLALIYIISFKVPLLYIRYVIFIVPFACMLAVLAWQKHTRILYFLVLLFLAISLHNLGRLPERKENYPQLIAHIDFRPKSDVVLLSNALPYFGLKYYSQLPVYISAKPDEIRQYEGRAYLEESDFWSGDLGQIERIWVPAIGESGVGEFKQKLVNEGFYEVSTQEISESFALSLFSR